MKPIYPSAKKKLLQRLLTVSLLVVFVISTLFLFVRYSLDQKLQHLLSVIEHISPDTEKAGEVLLLLNQAENDFQFAIFSSESSLLQDYKNSLQKAFEKIDTIVRQSQDTAFMEPLPQRFAILQLYQEKLSLSKDIYLLKAGFDSLLLRASQFIPGNIPLPLPATAHPQQQQQHSLATDTLVQPGMVIVPKKKGLFSRLRDAFSGKPDTLTNVPLQWINTHAETKLVDSIAKAADSSMNAYYRQSLQHLRQKQYQLSANQKTLFLANQRIMAHLKTLLNELKAVSLELANSTKSLASTEYRNTSAILNIAGTASLLLVLVFSLLLAIDIKKLNTAEKCLLREHELAITKAQQKTDLLATMSHEIRNPLNSIIGFLHELQKSGLNQQQTEMLDSIRVSSDMLLSTVNDVLDMSKLENGHFRLHEQPFNPYNIIRLTVEAMRFSAQGKKLLLGFRFNGNRREMVVGDSFRLKQILVNLLGNAIKFTSEGSVNVQAGLEKKGNSLQLQVTVTDTGTGISKEHQERLFTQYYQSSTANGTTGTGLGLYICQKLVLLQNGSIQVNSAPGKGSAFGFSLPYQAVEPQPQVHPVKQVADTAMLNGKRILIADDNEFNLGLLKIMTRSWDATLYFVTTGLEALEVLEKEPVDIVLTDLEMPEMDGLTLVRTIRGGRKLYASVPVILVSAMMYSSRQELDTLRKEGFTNSIPKPFTELQLVQKIVATLQERDTAPPNCTQVVALNLQRPVNDSY